MNKLYQRWLKLNIWLQFLPLQFWFSFYAIAVRHLRPALRGDECAYLFYTSNILQGFYSPPPPNINFWFGPGAPLLATPLLIFDLPIDFWCILNAFCYYASAVFIFEILKYLEIPLNWRFFFISIWVVFIPSYLVMSYVSTEPLACFLFTLSSWAWLKSEKLRTETNYIIISGISLGYLALTKVVFGYVMLVMLALVGLNFIITRSRLSLKFSKVLAIAFLITSPWLLYTYSLTGKFFYWGASGGAQIYWMSSPYPEESGSWDEGDLYIKQAKRDWSMEHRKILIRNHKSDWDKIIKLQVISQDSAFKAIAVQNIKSHPIKFGYNCLCNFSRLLFSTPRTGYVQDARYIAFIPTGSFMFIGILLIVGYCLFNFRNINRQLRYTMGIAGLYLSACIVLASYARMLVVVAPLLIIMIAYCSYQIVSKLVKTVEK